MEAWTNGAPHIVRQHKSDNLGAEFTVFFGMKGEP